MGDKNLVLDPVASAVGAPVWSIEGVLKIVVIAAFGLAALIIIVRSRYSLRGEGHGVKIEITPPEAPRPPPPRR